MECGNCGTEVSSEDDFCPSCGAQFSSSATGDTSSRVSGEPESRFDIGEKGYLGIGGISGVIAFGFLPPLFGVVSIFCGVQLWRHHDKKLGGGIILFGAVALIVGMYVGAQTMQ
ncbi:small CPxCG-related zinc finger protein [Natronomonas pharaonis DSM 2160]|uniref:Small CPxCG-related zinc finger protein n=1 Tax=Natronomonas pharaonis (strain ATCC 35678 / DSM 2160 / CIP 103997 / JCM 8858 / NBRC 14720 / NCIMB 2260 / Gabara) TaxID=348780 RepID=A0A1U7EVH9_NATPD|nr:zinc-ribbon domain-containing protein [Natronomonas pharaonis]CAI49030.1 small CPxCG-related zinc finger protein [Natronomonas pharaonis DSM 2160]